MMKPSESAAVMHQDGQPANARNDIQRHFNQTQHVYSEEKVYPGRAHTIDQHDLDNLHNDMSSSPLKNRNAAAQNFITEDST